MIRLEADLHVHTVASGHAYSTVEEITREAARRGLTLVGITDHGPGLPGGAHQYHFWNLRILPEVLNGVRILKLRVGELSLIELMVPDDSPAKNRQVRELGFPENAVAVAILRDSTVIVPHGNTVIQAGDSMLFVTRPELELNIKQILVG